MLRNFTTRATLDFRHRRQLTGDVTRTVSQDTGRRPRAGLAQSASGMRQVPGSHGLYNPVHEKDSCGVGLVVQMQKKASRTIVEDANEMMVRMHHRGGCGCDPKDGDGAGMLVGMPHSFNRKVAMEDLGITLPPNGQYGVGIVFTGKDDGSESTVKELLGTLAKRRGLDLLGWRTLPVDNSDLGVAAKGSEPRTLQCFVGNAKGYAPVDFERELYRLQKTSTAEAHDEASDSFLGPDKFYVCSMSSQTVTYKGQLTTAQVRRRINMY